MRRSFLALVLLLALSTGGALALPSAEEDLCKDGCPLSADTDVVCGSDGRTYASSCLALCQDVQVVATGRCLGRPGLHLKETEDTVISPEDISRFADQGLKLLGHAKVREFDPEESAKLTLKASTAPPPSKAAAAQLVAAFKALSASGPNPLAHTVVYTSDGLVYAGAQQAAAASETGKPANASDAFVPPANATDAENVTSSSSLSNINRKLRFLFGTDDRREITFSAAFPYSAIGYLQSRSSTGRCCSGCTAFMISPRAIMTAAHCVFDRDTNSWQKDFMFYPNLNSRNRAPYGSFGWTNVYTWAGYTNPTSPNPWPFDMAIIRLSGTGTTLGNRLGYFGLTTHTSLSGALNTAGYPGDKPQGTYWYTSCPVSDTNGSNGEIRQYCDIWNGQSGSPMWTGDNFARGVVSYGLSVNGQPSYNVAAEVTPARLPDLLNWR